MFHIETQADGILNYDYDLDCALSFHSPLSPANFWPRSKSHRRTPRSLRSMLHSYFGGIG